MDLQNEQDLLAKLYTDRSLREQLLNDRSNDSGRTLELAAAAAEEVRWFAESLVSKRLREVEKLLPSSRQEIGAKEFERQFRLFADTFSPVSVKKHLEDTLKFAKYLDSQASLEPVELNTVRFESSMLRHRSLGRAVSFRLLRFDPRKLTGYKVFEPRPGLGIWVAIHGWSRIVFRPSRG